MGENAHSLRTLRLSVTTMLLPIKLRLHSDNLSESCFHDTEICSEADELDLECEPGDDCESEDTPPDERKDLLLPASKPVCNSFCCTSSEVYQPSCSNVLKKTERVYGTGNNRRTRRLLPTWYKSFLWLHFCCSTLRVYCHHGDGQDEGTKGPQIRAKLRAT